MTLASLAAIATLAAATPPASASPASASPAFESPAFESPAFESPAFESPAFEAAPADLRSAPDDLETPRPLTTPPEGEARRSGLYGLGLGVELPMVGVLGGIGTESNVGAGYTLGAAISYEILPSIAVRVFGTWGATQRGSATVTFGRSGERISSVQDAEWFDFTLGAGGAYLFRRITPSLAPYVGADVGMTLITGFEYRFDQTLEDLTDDKAQGVQFADDRILGRDIGFTGDLRAGVRLHLTDWLASLAELSVAYVHKGDDRINNTLNGPDVRSLAEDIWLVRATFSVRLGL